MRTQITIASATTAAMLIAMIAWLAGAQVVFAHSRPVRFDPAPGAVLSAAPAQVNGWFTSDIRRDPNWSFIKVTDAQGNVVSSGDPVLSSDRRQMSTGLKPGLGAGAYTATWRTWDDIDGAIFGDCFNFFVGQAAADGAYSGKTRLDNGGKCDRIDVEAKNGTPVPGETPTTSASAAEADATSPSTTSSSSGISTLFFGLGLVGALAVGLVAGRVIFFGKRS